MPTLDEALKSTLGDLMSQVIFLRTENARVVTEITEKDKQILELWATIRELRDESAPEEREAQQDEGAP